MNKMVVGASGLSLNAELQLTRRQALTRAFGLVSSCVAMPAWAQATQGYASDFWIRPRRVRLQHASGEEITSVYWSDGQLLMDEYIKLSWFMRDRIANKAVYMNPVLLDITYGVCGWLEYFGVTKPIILTSGHRDAARNATIEGAARNSLHIRGDALDIRISSVPSQQVARFGQWLGGGGVGWYPSKGFTHLDRGRLRVWRG